MAVVGGVIHAVRSVEGHVDDRPGEEVQEHRVVRSAADAGGHQRLVGHRAFGGTVFRVQRLAPCIVERRAGGIAQVVGHVDHQRRQRADGRGLEVGARGGGVHVQVGHQLGAQLRRELLAPLRRTGERDLLAVPGAEDEGAAAGAARASPSRPAPGSSPSSSRCRCSDPRRRTPRRRGGCRARSTRRGARCRGGALPPPSSAARRSACPPSCARGPRRRGDTGASGRPATPSAPAGRPGSRGSAARRATTSARP